MTDFTLRVNERAFSNRGIRVDFDEQRYGELLEQLTTEADVRVPANWTPIVTLSPADVWGMSPGRKTVNYMAHNEIDPTSSYDTDTKTVSVKAAENSRLTNELLLYATRRWSGHLSGELRDAEDRDHRRRYLRRSELAVPTGALAFAGFEAAGGQGAVIGGIFGFMGGLAIGTVDMLRSPFRREVRAFSKNPEVLAQYGQIVKYKTASY